MKKIDSLQALRAICYIGIFLSHVGFEYSYAALAVCTFFVLSGFLTMYRSKENYEKLSLKVCFKSAFSRIKKIYLLHVIATLAVAAMDCYNLFLEQAAYTSYINILIKIVLDLTLTKTLVPSIEVCSGLNGVSWFLSAIFIIYLISPYLVRFVNKHSKAALTNICVVLVLLQIASCIPMYYFYGIESGVCQWFMYYFPLFRLVDYFCGLVVGKYYQDTLNMKINKVFSNLFFIVLIALSILIIYVYDPFGSIYMSAALNWTSKCIPVAVLWVIVFLRNDTIFTKLLTNSFTCLLGDLNMFLFLIHNVVIIGFDFFEVSFTLGNIDLTTIAIFFFSLLLGVCYSELIRKESL